MADASADKCHPRRSGLVALLCAALAGACASGAGEPRPATTAAPLDAEQLAQLREVAERLSGADIGHLDPNVFRNTHILVLANTASDPGATLARGRSQPTRRFHLLGNGALCWLRDVNSAATARLHDVTCNPIASP